MHFGNFHMQYMRHTYQTLGSALPTLTQFNNKKPLTSYLKGVTLEIKESLIYFITTKEKK